MYRHCVVAWLLTFPIPLFYSLVNVANECVLGCFILIQSNKKHRPSRHNLIKFLVLVEHQRWSNQVRWVTRDASLYLIKDRKYIIDERTRQSLVRWADF